MKLKFWYIPSKILCTSSLLHFYKSFGEISPKSTKSYQVSHHNRYILLQLGNFIEILIKGNNLLWYKSMNITYRSFQDVFWVQNRKIMPFFLFTKLYIGEIFKSALILVKILLFSWQIMGHNQNFDFCPRVSIKSIFSNINGAGHLQNFTFGHVLCSILHLV